MRPGDTTSTKRKRCFNTTISKSFGPLCEAHIKRSKTTPLKPISKPTTMLNLDDLPDFVLVEILGRLPCGNAVQCMLVSKRWYNLVSNPYFVGRFLHVQSDNQKPIPHPTMIFTDPKHTRKFFSMSKQPLAPKKRKFSLSFLPCFQGPVKTLEDEPIVVAAYNDLVLCCATVYFQHRYYICNPYTKQWNALPSPPQLHKEVRVGFICDPYYNECREDGRTIFQVNVEYKYRVVRLIPGVVEIPENSSFQFKAEIFSSETGEWREYVALSPRSFCVTSLRQNFAGVACNGMLYWWSNEGFIIGLDPYSHNNITTTTSSTVDGNGDHKYNCRFIDMPEDDQVSLYGYYDCLGVCRARGGECLRLCQFTGNSENKKYDFLSVWEFKDDQVDNTGKWHLVGRVSPKWMASQNPLIMKWRNGSRWAHKIMFLAYDPDNEHILYLEFLEHIVACNIKGEGKLEVIWSTPFDRDTIYTGRVFPFVLPWWPTPVTRHKQALSSNHAAEEHGRLARIGVAKAKDNPDHGTTRTRSSSRRTRHQEIVVTKKGSASNTKKRSTLPASNLRAGKKRKANEADKKKSAKQISTKLI